MAETEFITVGDEIVSGTTEDTNFSFAAREIVAAGISSPRRRTSVGDSEEDIVSALRQAQRADFALVCGGLGPTPDDLTAACAAKAFGLACEKNPGALDAVKTALKKMKRTILPAHEKQAMLPKGSEVIDNTEGVAPGFAVKTARTVFYFMPGVPAEFRAMVTGFVIPDMLKRSGTDGFSLKAVSVFGLPESELARRVEQLKITGANIAYRIKGHEIEVRVSHPDDPETVEKTAQKISEHLGKAAFSTSGATLTEAVARVLKERNLTVSAAESCTGGMLSSALTDIAGSSVYFLGGVVAYSNRSKSDRLGVLSETIEKYGAVSKEVAGAMAERARERFGSDIGIGITGIAGPEGGTVEKPVGTVYIATAAGGSAGGTVSKYEFAGKRSAVRSRSVSQALDMIMRTALSFPVSIKKTTEQSK